MSRHNDMLKVRSALEANCDSDDAEAFARIVDLVDRLEVKAASARLDTVMERIVVTFFGALLGGLFSLILYGAFAGAFLCR